MNIGILGDIHGNKDALNAVLNAAKACNVARLLITGDLVGYYPFAKEVLVLLAAWDVDIVRGNHEDMLQQSITDKTYLEKITAKYGTGLLSSINELSAQQIDYLINLPHPLLLNIENKDIMLSHGSPININDYFYPDNDFTTCDWVTEMHCDIFICGHTHYPMKKVVGDKIVLNPGSVGQPRNKGSAAHWVLYDTSSQHFEFKTEDYNTYDVIEWAKDTNPNLSYLHRVFTRQ
ncbi:YfcE family phosphodiesterase [Amylibacter sp.]|nr:YfcE family phosphodiesterase [Amylibacter sp.]